MKIFKLIYVLYKIKLLSPLGLYNLLYSLCKYGINVMTLLNFAAKVYGDKIAIEDENEKLSYNQLLLQSEKLSIVLKDKYDIEKGYKVGVLCKNNTSLIKSIFSLSYLGADIYLINAEISLDQLNKLLVKHDFKLLIYDFELSCLIEQSGYKNEKIISCHNTLPCINSLVNLSLSKNIKLKRSSLSKIVILTGGTTGDFKAAAHKPSVFNFLNPFIELVLKLRLVNYKTSYIATPIYHGYGVAVLFLFIALGYKIAINKGFDADKACKLIYKHRIEVVTVVPLMVYKMLKINPENLKSLRCIVSGGAELKPKLVKEVSDKLGNVLYNLYGTSEAGLNMIATPEDLGYSPKTIGKKINGVQIKIMDNNLEVDACSIGKFHIKNKWSMKNSLNPWIETGDLGYRDEKNYYFFCGRADDMVVSAGENVYPFEVEQILLKHNKIEEAAVVGVPDEVFGQRLKAYVLPVKNAEITEEEVFAWLRSKAARYQIPKEIVLVDSMPYTAVGKLNKKELKQI